MTDERAPKTFVIGKKVVCTYAASSWYKVGDVYDVVKHPETGGPAVKARDGFLDLPSLVSSKFEPFVLKAMDKLAGLRVVK